MNMGYVSDTARTRTRNLFRPKHAQILLGHSVGQVAAVYPASDRRLANFVFIDLLRNCWQGSVIISDTVQHLLHRYNSKSHRNGAVIAGPASNEQQTAASSDFGEVILDSAKEYLIRLGSWLDLSSYSSPTRAARRSPSAWKNWSSLWTTNKIKVGYSQNKFFIKTRFLFFNTCLNAYY